jgi:D-sedoheptulose 7-phosphate isomerase
MSERDIRRIFAASAAARDRFERRHSAALAQVIELVTETLMQHGTLFFFGNGGSAADAQHLAAEFVNRYQIDRSPLPAVALTTDSSALTSIANDFGYRRVFSKQIEALGRRGDLAFAISTSGNAGNVLAAVSACRRLGITTVGMTGGDGGKLAAAVDHLLSVDSTRETARIQETHILIGHVICELVERALVRRSKTAPRRRGGRH